MQNVKPVTTPLAAHFRLSSTQCPQLDEEVDYISRVPHFCVVGSLMMPWCALIHFWPIQSMQSGSQ